MILAIVFASAALTKGYDPPEAIVGVSAALGVDFRIAWILTVPVVWGEWTLAVALIALHRKHTAYIASLALLLVFVMYLLRLGSLDRPPPCGCGGVSDLLARATGEQAVHLALVRNSALMMCCLVGLVAERRCGDLEKGA